MKRELTPSPVVFVCGALAVLAVLTIATRAEAQGLATRLAPAGLVLADVRAPDDPDHAVRLSFAPSAQASVEVWIDVYLARDSAEAGRRAEFWQGTASRGLDARPDLAARAWGDARMSVIAIDRWVVHARVLRGRHDASEIAHRAATTLATARPVASRAPRLIVDRALQGDEPVPVRIDGDVIAAWVVADGAAYARRTPAGTWVLAPSGDGAYGVRAVAVNADLSVVELTARGASSSAAAEE